MIKTFTTTNLKEVREDINKALASVMAKHGLTIDLGNISYTGDQFTSKITAKVTNGGTKEDVAKREWDRWAPLYGMKAEWFGKEVRIGGSLLTITGIDHKKRKNIVQITSKNGTNYVTSKQEIIDALS
jgi:hypothetical protein